MGRELPRLCQVESRRLLWLMGVTFALIITFQYLELPYGISSLFSANKIPVATRNGTSETGPPLPNSESFANSSTTNSLNSTNLFPAPEGNGLGPIRNDYLNGSNKTGNSVTESTGEKSGKLNKNSTVNDPEHLGNSTYALAPAEIEENANNFSQKNDTLGNNSEEDEENVDPIFDNNKSPNASYDSPSLALPPTSAWSEKVVDSNANAPVIFTGFNTSYGERDLSVPTFDKNKEKSQDNSSKSGDNASAHFVPDVKETPEMPHSGVVSIADMNYLLHQSRASRHSKRPRWPSDVDQELLYAKTQIENAPTDEKDHVLYASLYHNVSMFKRSYELMEKMLKVYIYKEGKKPIMHNPKWILTGIYASEAWFMKLLESDKIFVTKDPKKAHLFYLPFSSRMLEVTLYVQDSHSHKNLIQYLKDYLDLISAKYPFWNRTSGADHFLVACHDWAPSETRKHMANCIRALCNSDVKEGFVFGKDASLPETNVRNSQKPLKEIGGKPASQRSNLAFFAGKMHGYLRPVLLSYWGNNKDPDMKIFGRLPKSKGNRNYIQFMKTSKYCICAKGYEVNSPRVVEAISFECVPVIISDNFVPPFFEVLNWESFAVFVLEKDIPNLKNILLSIPERRYKEMQMRVKKVQKHFLWHVKPEKYDIFHMILHSVWYNRVFQISG